MKTAMKKLFSLLLVAVLLVGMMPFQANAASTYYQIVFTDGDQGNINGYLTPGNTFRPSDYIPVGYSFVSCTQNFGIGGAASIDQYDVREIGDGDSFIMEVRKVVVPACPKCGSTGHTEAYDYCGTCNKCGGHNDSAYCTVLVNGVACGKAHCADAHCPKCGLTDHDGTAHCNICGALESACPVTCPGNPAYVPAPTTATINVQINNNIHDGSFSIAAGKTADEVIAAYRASDLAALHAGAYDPTVTLDDMRTPMTATVAGETYYLWLSWNAPATDDGSEDEPELCEVCGKADHDATCPGHPDYIPCDKCWTDPCTCDTCTECGNPKDNHKETCTQHPNYTRGKVKVYLNLNYDGAYGYREKMGYVWAERNALLSEVLFSVPAPNRDKHTFRYWTTDIAGVDIINEDNQAKATADGVMVYAQWADDVQSTNGKIFLRVNLNYDHKLAEPVTNIVFGAKMGNVLEHVATPYRWKYKFDGWYWDSACTDPVEYNDRIYMHDEIFAKWERRYTNNEIMLKIYLNGNTTSVAQVVDMYTYSLDDGEISLSEVKEVVKKYYTSRNSDGMYFEGLFDTNGWSSYVRNPKFNRGSKDIDVRFDDDTVVYVMVRNAKIRTNTNSSSSSATADSSNPKTGDTIFTAVTVMGASAACLATLFYLNKKRAY